MKLLRNVGLAVLGMGLFLGEAQAQTQPTTIFVKPGDSGTLSLPFGNDPASLDNLENVSVLVNAPPQVQILSASLLGPVTIAPGQDYTFVVSYTIDPNAAEGSYAVTLNMDIPGQIVDPAADALQSQVSFSVVKDTSAAGCRTGCPPILASLSPAQATAGDLDTTVSVAGSSFTSGAVLALSAAGAPAIELPTAFESAARLRAVVPGSLLRAPVVYAAGVVNPDRLASNAIDFVVRAVAPVVTGVDPPAVDAESPSVTLTISGDHFSLTTRVTVNGIQLAAGEVTFVSPTTLLVRIPGSYLSAAGGLDLQVVNGAGLGAAAAAAPASLSVVPRQGPRPLSDLSGNKTLGSTFDLGATDDGGVASVFVTYPDGITKGGSHPWSRLLHAPFAAVMSGVYRVEYADFSGNRSAFTFTVSGSPFLVMRTSTTINRSIIQTALIEGPGDFAKRYRLFTEDGGSVRNGPDDFRKYCDLYWSVAGGQCYYTGAGTDGWESIIAPSVGDGAVHATISRGNSPNQSQTVNFVTNQSANRQGVTAVTVGVGAGLSLLPGESADLTIDIPYVGQDVYRCAGANLCVSAKVPPPDISCAPPTDAQRQAMYDQGLYPACGLSCTVSPSPAVFFDPVVFSVSGCPTPPGGTDPNGATCCTQDEGGRFVCGGPAAKTCANGACAYTCQMAAASAWGIFVPITGPLPDATPPVLSATQVSADGLVWLSPETIVASTAVFARAVAQDSAGRSEGTAGLEASTQPIAPALLNLGTPLQPKGTLALLRFDEGSGATATDASGHGVDAAVPAGVAWAPGRFGAALEYDGQTGKPPLGNPTLLGQAVFTVSAWIYPLSSVGIQAILGNRRDNNQGFQFGLSGGRAMLRLSASNPELTTSVAGGPILSLNEWHHIAATFDGSTAVVYADGVQAARLANVRYAVSGGLAYLGQSSEGFAYRGRVDELRVLNFAQDRSAVAAEFRRGYWAQYSVDGGRSWKAVPDANLSFGATTGSPGPAYLTVSNLQLGESLTDNLVDFMVSDAAGNLASLSTVVKTPPPDDAAPVVSEPEVSNDGAAWFPQGTMLPGATVYLRAQVRDPPSPPKRLSGLQVATEPAAPAVVPGTLVLLHFDEASGATAGDASGNGNFLTFQGDPPLWTSGRIGAAANFGGNTFAYLNAPLASPRFTLSMWFKVPGSDRQVLFDSESGSGGAKLTLLPPAGLRFELQGGSGQAGGAITAPFPAVGAWHHFAASYDGAVLTAYLDGAQTGRVAAAYAPSGSPPFVGSAQGGFVKTTGAIDELRWVDHALSRAEILRGFRGGTQAIYTADGGDTWSQAAASLAGAVQGAPGPFLLTAGAMPMALSASSNAVELIAEDVAGNLAATDFAVPTGTAPLSALASSSDAVASLRSFAPNMTLTAVSTGAAASQAFAAAAAGQNLVAVTPFYELAPSPIRFSTPAVLGFVFEPAGVDTATVAIFRFNGVAWDSGTVSNQTITLLADGRFTVTGRLLATSLYGVFFNQPDTLPPATRLLVLGDRFVDAYGTLFGSARSSVAFFAEDFAAGSARPSGVDFTEFSLDTAPAFARFTAPFGLAEGRHLVRFRSQDRAGNRETPRSATVAIDATPPVVASSFSLQAVLRPPAMEPWFPADFFIVWSATDAASGVDFVDARTSVAAEGRGLAFVGRARDRVQNEGSLTVVVNVDKTPPRVVAGPAIQVFEGSTAAFAGSAADNLDPAPVASWDFGDGGGATTAVATHAYLDNATFYAVLSATDHSGLVSSDTARVTVLNAPPAVLPMPDRAAAEGAFVAVVSSFTDPGVLDTHTALIDWGDGNASTAAVSESRGSGSAMARHAYGDDGRYRVSVTVTDKDGGVGTSTFTIAVSNVAPAVDAGRDQAAAAQGFVIVGGTIPARAMAVLVPGDPRPKTLPIGPVEPVAIPAVLYSDPGFDNPAPNDPAKATREDFTSVFDWGDQTSSSQPEVTLTKVSGREGVLTTGTASAPHRYRANGVYLFKPTVTDDDQGSGSGAIRITVDVAPPETSISHAGNFSRDPGLPQGASVFLDAAATSLLSAVDPVVNGVAFGVQWTFRRDNLTEGTSALFTLSDAPFNLSQEGLHALEFFSVDKRGNEEGHRLLTIAVDTTPPVSSLSIGAPQVPLPGILLVSSRTPFTIPSFDPVSKGVASGVKDTSYRISDVAPGNAPFGAFTAAFTLAAPDGVKLVEFYSRDKVLNTEGGKSSAVLLDSTPPELSLLSPAACDSGICRVLKGRFPVLGTARDLHFRDYRLEYAPGKDAASDFVLISSGAVAVSSGVLGLWDTRTLAGWLTMRLTATDLVQNVSVLPINVFVGDPGELMTLGNHELFNMPEGVAVGSDGNIYVADRDNDRVAVFSAAGTLLASLTGLTGAPRLNKPSGVAVDAAGRVFIADTNNNRVLALSATGQVLLAIGRLSGQRGENGEEQGSRRPGEFNKPSGVALDIAGNIHVSDTENRRVQVFTPTGAFAFLFELPPVPRRKEGDEREERQGDDDERGEAGKPAGIALDASGRIYVADPKGHRALVFGATGQLLLTIPIAGQPHGVAVSPSGNCLLVSDRKLGRVLKFDSRGSLNLLFGGKGKLKDDDDERKRPAGVVFNKPMGLALDAEGSLYIADRNNDRVRKFSLPTGQPTIVVPQPLPEDEHVARGVLDREDGGKVGRKDKAAVDIPAGALAWDLKISVSAPGGGGLSDDSSRRRALENLALKPASPPVEFSPEGVKFQAPVTLTIPYSPRLARTQGVSEDDLKVAYWNRDKSLWEDLDSVVDKKTRTVSAKTSHFSLYQVLSGTVSAVTPQALPQADPTFAFRDLYVFPDPAARGAVPTFHVAVGVADKVTLRVFDVAGRPVTTVTLDRAPLIVDDGSGPQYAYEYAWTGRIPSGVYLYTLEAEKGGYPTIRKGGRFGVVR